MPTGQALLILLTARTASRLYFTLTPPDPRNRLLDISRIPPAR